MKKNIITVALLAVLGLTAVSCQKENIVENSYPAAETVATRTVRYTVDGVTSQISIVGEAAWNDFLGWLFTMAEEGHRVTFSLVDRVQRLSKEKVTFTTNNKDEAIAWATDMTNSGYEVTIEFDEANGQYICTAIK